jgi:hypothetical protein
VTHADLPGGWRANTLQDAVMGVLPIERALHLVGVRSGQLAVKAAQDLTDAVAAWNAGDETTALATAADLAEEIRRARQPRTGAAA